MSRRLSGDSLRWHLVKRYLKAVGRDQVIRLVERSAELIENKKED